MTEGGCFAALDHRFRVISDHPTFGSTARALLAPMTTTEQPRSTYTGHRTPDGGVALSWCRERLITTSDLGLALSTLLWHLNQTAVRCSPGLVLVHGAALAPPDGDVLVITGPSGSGKSTLAAALAGRGWGYLTDEVVAIDDRGRVHAYARPLALSGDARARVEATNTPTVEAADGEVLVDAALLGAGPAPTLAPVAGIVILDPERERDVVQPVTAGEAVLALAHASFNLRSRPEVGLRVLAEVAIGARAVRIACEGIDGVADAAATFVECGS